MNILIYDNDNKGQSKINENEKILISKEGICPECGGNFIINIKDYKISYECKNSIKIIIYPSMNLQIDKK